MSWTHSNSWNRFGLTVRVFDADTKFELVIDIRSMLAMDWDPGFWKTFKFRIYGVECLTFNEEWANEVKEKVTKATGIRRRCHQSHWKTMTQLSKHR